MVEKIHTLIRYLTILIVMVRSSSSSLISGSRKLKKNIFLIHYLKSLDFSYSHNQKDPELIDSLSDNSTYISLVILNAQ